MLQGVALGLGRQLESSKRQLSFNIKTVLQTEQMFLPEAVLINLLETSCFLKCKLGSFIASLEML